MLHCAHYFFRVADRIICHASREHFRHWAHQPMQGLGITNSVPRYTELKAKLLHSMPHSDALCTKAAISQLGICAACSCQRNRRLVTGLIPRSFKSERSPLLMQVAQAFMSKAGKLLLMYSTRPSNWLVAELYMASRVPPSLARPLASAAESSACARIGGLKPFLRCRAKTRTIGTEFKFT